MAQKSLEIVVRDLQRIIGELVNKVTSLETKIDAQNATIIKQEATMGSLKTAVEGKLKTISAESPAVDVPTVPVLPAIQQRPVRQARINAAARAAAAAAPKTVSASTTAADKKTATKLQSQRASLTAAQPTTPEAVRSEPTPDSRTNSSNKPARPITADRGEAGKTNHGVLSEHLTLKDGMINDDQNGWHVVSRQRRRPNPRQITIGTGEEKNYLQAAEKTMYIQAWSFKPDTTIENVLNFLNSITKADYTVEKRQIKTERHASFLIGMPENVFTQVTTPTAWPPRIRFVPWFPSRPRREERWGLACAAAAAAGGTQQ